MPQAHQKRIREAQFPKSFLQLKPKRGLLGDQGIGLIGSGRHPGTADDESQLHKAEIGRLDEDPVEANDLFNVTINQKQPQPQRMPLQAVERSPQQEQSAQHTQGAHGSMPRLLSLAGGVDASPSPSSLATSAAKRDLAAQLLDRSTGFQVSARGAPALSSLGLPQPGYNLAAKRRTARLPAAKEKRTRLIEEVR